MAFTPSSPVTCAAMSGFTTPTATIAIDTAPSQFGKQYYVASVSGQPSVTAHTVGSPFTVTFVRPVTLRIVEWFSSITGWKRPNPKNEYRIIVRKGATPVAGAPIDIILFDGVIKVPAGVETYDAPNLKAFFSFLCGTLWATASGIYDTTTNGALT